MGALSVTPSKNPSVLAGTLPGMVWTMTCGYCGEGVDRDMRHLHVHDPKVCQDCRRSLPAQSFDRHPSSADGRRHSCNDCAALRRQNDRKDRLRRERESLAGHGYQWKRWSSGWVLLDDTGRQISKPDALEAIARSEMVPLDEDYPW
jgi:hypothetical protein